MLDPFIGGSQQVEGVGWRDPYGSVSHIDFATRALTSWSNVRTSNFKVTDFGYIAAVSKESNTTKLIANTRLPFLNTIGVQDFSLGRAVLNNSWTCIQTAAGASCTFVPCDPTTRACNLYSTYGPLESFTSLSANAQLPVISLLNGFYVNAANVLTYLGIKTCLDGTGVIRAESFATVSSCSMYIPLGANNIPALGQISRISVDSWGACVITGGSLSCWSHVTYTSPPPWTAYKSVTWVDVNDTGACVQYIDTDLTQKMSCWGTPYSATVPNPAPPPSFITITNIVSLLPNLRQTLSGPQTYITPTQPYFPCPNPSDVVDANICIPCAYGSYLTPNANGYASCSICTSTAPVRGIGHTSCQTCSLGTEPSPNFSSCISCSSNSINSISTFSKCVECPPGFQASANRQSCVACPLINTSLSVRERGAPQCRVCNLPSFYVSSGEPCATCSQPTVPRLSNTSFSCVPCSPGFDANSLGSCTQCSLSYARNTSQTTCTLCPPGFESSVDFSSCTQCTGNTFRQAALACAECPKGTFVNKEFTSCSQPNVVTTPTLSIRQTAFLSTGLGILLIVFASSAKLSRAQIIIGIFISLSIAASGYFLS